MIYNPDVAAIGVALLIAIGLLATRGEHVARTRIRSTDKEQR